LETKLSLEERRKKEAGVNEKEVERARKKKTDLMASATTSCNS
jgi:hypothetical protein